MLHILWMLIKWILILLGILLGLLLVLAALLLFCPVCYRTAAVKEGVPIKEAGLEAGVSWLFGGVCVRYCRGKKLDVRIFGISIVRLRERWKKSSGRRTVSKKEKPAKPLDVLDSQTESPPLAEPEKIERESRGSADFQEAPPEKSGKPRNKHTAFREKLKEILELIKNIPRLFERISLTISRFCAKINWWKEFAGHPASREGISFFKKKMSRLLRHISPRKLQGKITFGSEDPSVTGAVLAVLGMTIPLHQNRVEILPVFENRNLLEGQVCMKGRIYGIVLLMTALELYFNKNIKDMIRRWKHKEV